MHQAKKVVLDLLGFMGSAMDVTSLVCGGEILGVDSGAIRVALTRLKARGLVVRLERGVWALEKNARHVSDHVHGWRGLNSRACAWNGTSWLGVHLVACAAKETKRCRRALNLLGFMTLKEGLCVRPDNLLGGVGQVRVQLHNLGLEPEACVFVMQALDESTQKQASSLWKTKELDIFYSESIERIAQAEQSLNGMELSQAARLIYEVGDDVIRQLAFDPVLPAPMVNVYARARCVEEMRMFDHRGKSIWRQVMARRLGI